MSFMASIVNALNSASSWFYQLYLNCYYAGWPLSSIASWFYSLSIVFNTLAWAFSDFSAWVSDVAAKVAQMLSWSTIWSYILSYVPNLVTIRDWFYGWWGNVTSVVTSWWSATLGDVKGLIRAAGDELKSYINSILLTVNSLAASWDNFKGRIPTIDQVISWWGNWWGNILPQLGTWWNSRLLEVQGLIDSAFTARQSLWAGWQDFRGKVTEFFTDPEEWLYKSADRIIERFW